MEKEFLKNNQLLKLFVKLTESNYKIGFKYLKDSDWNLDYALAKFAEEYGVVPDVEKECSVREEQNKVETSPTADGEAPEIVGEDSGELKKSHRDNASGFVTESDISKFPAYDSTSYLYGLTTEFEIVYFKPENEFVDCLDSSDSSNDSIGNLDAILNRTGYSLHVTTNQRTYGGPPPDWDNKSPPEADCQVFIGEIPKIIFEDELIPVFEKWGQIWDLRLMMDPLTGLNRGYAFITYCNKEAAQQAVKQMDQYEIRSGKYLKVSVSVSNLQLLVNNIPKVKSREEIFEEFSKVTAGLIKVSTYSTSDDENRGFCFLEYESLEVASVAKYKLESGEIKFWGCDIIIKWADSEVEPDEECLNKEACLIYEPSTSQSSSAQMSKGQKKSLNVKRSHCPSPSGTTKVHCKVCSSNTQYLYEKCIPMYKLFCGHVACGICCDIMLNTGCYFCGKKVFDGEKQFLY